MNDATETNALDGKAMRERIAIPWRECPEIPPAPPTVKVWTADHPVSGDCLWVELHEDGVYHWEAWSGWTCDTLGGGAEGTLEAARGAAEGVCR